MFCQASLIFVSKPEVYPSGAPYRAPLYRQAPSLTRKYKIWPKKTCQIPTLHLIIPYFYNMNARDMIHKNFTFVNNYEAL